MVKEEHDHAIAAEHIHGLVIAFLAGEQAQAPAFAGFLHVGLEAGKIEGAVNGGDFRSGAFDEGGEKGVGFQEGKMRRKDNQRAG